MAWAPSACKSGTVRSEITSLVDVRVGSVQRCACAGKAVGGNKEDLIDSILGEDNVQPKVYRQAAAALNLSVDLPADAGPWMKKCLTSGTSPCSHRCGSISPKIRRKDISTDESLQQGRNASRALIFSPQ